MNRPAHRIILASVASVCAAAIASSASANTASTFAPHEVYPLIHPNVFPMDFDQNHDTVTATGTSRTAQGHMQCEAKVDYGNGRSHTFWFNVIKEDDAYWKSCPNWVKGVDFDGNGRFNPIFGWVGNAKYGAPQPGKTLEVSVFPTDRNTYVMGQTWRPFAPETNTNHSLYFPDLNGDGRSDVVEDSAVDLAGHHHQWYTGTDGKPGSAQGIGVLGYSIFGDFDQNRDGVEYYHFRDAADLQVSAVKIDLVRLNGTDAEQVMLPGLFEKAYVNQAADILTLVVETNLDKHTFTIGSDGNLS